MRDIRDDLTERLHTFREERQRVQARLREIDAQEAAVKALLDAENRRFAQNQRPVTLIDDRPLSDLHDAKPHFAATSDLRRVVLQALSDGEPRHRAEITKVVGQTGMETNGALGRSIQGTLLSLRHQGVVKALHNGNWQLVK